MTRWKTPQQLDPLGGITARLIVIVAGIIAVGVAIALTITGWEQVSTPWIAALAIAVLAADVGYFIYASSPYVAPLKFGSHVIICLGALLAVALDELSQWGSNTLIRDDWGPISMAIVVISLGSYRAPWELLACSIGSSAIIGGIAVIVGQSGTLVTPVPPAVFIVTMVTPVLASGIASAAFSRTLIRRMLSWRASLANNLAVTGDATAPTGHLAFLHGTVIPFLDRVVTTGELGVDDGARARLLAQELRVLMVIDAEQSWLTGVVDRFEDPARVAHELDAEQRGCLRALITHLQSSEAFAKRSVRLRLGIDNGRPAGVLDVDTLAHHNPRAELAPYIAVARHVFPLAEAVFTSTGFALTFRL